ncbi:MAG: hypothetical protein HKN02_11050 [Rhodobacteraceae bacterium]|nr:hypothetical protein [Paracoccaceae bacterium]
MDKRVWRQLAAYEDFRGYLQALNGTVLAGFAANLAVDADVHMVERHFRETWKGYVAEIGSWHGDAFSKAFRLLAELPDLPARSFLDRGEPHPVWLAGAAQTHEEPPLHAEATLDAWRAAFLSALPGKPERQEAAHVLDRLIASGRGEGPDAARLRETAERLFRRAKHPFGRVLAHLACVASDLMDMRGELCVRRVLDRVAKVEGVA